MSISHFEVLRLVRSKQKDNKVAESDSFNYLSSFSKYAWSKGHWACFFFFTLAAPLHEKNPWFDVFFNLLFHMTWFFLLSVFVLFIFIWLPSHINDDWWPTLIWSTMSIFWITVQWTRLLERGRSNKCIHKNSSSSELSTKWWLKRRREDDTRWEVKNTRSKCRWNLNFYRFWIT